MPQGHNRRSRRIETVTPGRTGAEVAVTATVKNIGEQADRTHRRRLTPDAREFIYMYNNIGSGSRRQQVMNERDSSP
jgi:hypothetical protein